jgi:hypothetical protein
VEVPHFNGTSFVSWKYQISSYLREMNYQVWWIVDVGHQPQAQKNCLYLEAHASNALFSALSAEIKDEIEIEYGLFERANILWMVLEQIFVSNNDKR